MAEIYDKTVSDWLYDVMHSESMQEFERHTSYVMEILEDTRKALEAPSSGH